jgi:UDP-GlcNAc:undecaprenyl-phosphate GlcNAc-1-phosphate transferase
MTLKALIPQLTTLAILSILLIAVARTHAPKLSLLDRPGGRKTHIGEIPTVGGLSIYVAFVLGTSLQFDLLTEYAVLLLGMGFLAIVGAIDDAIDIRPPNKLAAQLVAALLLVFASGFPLLTLGRIPQIPMLDDWAMPVGLCLTLFIVLWVINAINMVDGIDGMAGGLVVIGLIWLGIGADLKGSADMPTIIIRLVVPLLVFLAFNHRTPWTRRASVFMGDAGTMMLGYAISWFLLELRAQGTHLLACSLVLSIPMVDTASLFFRRVFAGRSPFQGDRQHLHHLLETAGIPTPAVPLVVNAAAAALGGFGILGDHYGWQPAIFAVAWALIVLVHTAVVGILLNRHAGASRTQVIEPSRAHATPHRSIP